MRNGVKGFVNAHEASDINQAMIVCLLVIYAKLREVMMIIGFLSRGMEFVAIRATVVTNVYELL